MTSPSSASRVPGNRPFRPVRVLMVASCLQRLRLLPSWRSVLTARSAARPHGGNGSGLTHHRESPRSELPGGAAREVAAVIEKARGVARRRQVSLGLYKHGALELLANLVHLDLQALVGG